MSPLAKCPQCKSKTQVPRGSVGTKQQCQSCGAAFTVEVAIDETIVPASKPAPVSRSA